MEIDFVTYGKPMKKRKGNIFASRILHIPDIEQKLTSPLKNVITGFDCNGKGRAKQTADKRGTAGRGKSEEDDQIGKLRCEYG